MGYSQWRKAFPMPDTPVSESIFKARQEFAANYSLRSLACMS